MRIKTSVHSNPQFEAQTYSKYNYFQPSKPRNERTKSFATQFNYILH